MEETIYVIKNSNQEYACYGRDKWNKSIRFARQYKSKKTALKNYFNINGNYDNLFLEKIIIKKVSEELINANEFAENKSRK